jgi:hypothetical protein
MKINRALFINVSQCAMLSIFFLVNAMAQQPGGRNPRISRQEIEDYLRKIYHDDNIVVVAVTDVKPGQSEKGHDVTKPGESVLALDLSPCEQQKTVVQFSPPYHKEDISPVNCSGQQISRILVTKE